MNNYFGTFMCFKSLFIKIFLLYFISAIFRIFYSLKSCISKLKWFQKLIFLQPPLHLHPAQRSHRTEAWNDKNFIKDLQQEKPSYNQFPQHAGSEAWEKQS